MLQEYSNDAIINIKHADFKMHVHKLTFTHWKILLFVTRIANADMIYNLNVGMWNSKTLSISSIIA